MTPEAQRIAIAEACGWTQTQLNGRTTVWDRPNVGRTLQPPDYLNDLNAMHEAEGTIYPNFATAPDDELRAWMRYRKYLGKVGMNDCQEGAGLDERLIRATAAQRAEAFLRTLNLWTE